MFRRGGCHLLGIFAVALGAGANRSLSDADGSGWLGEGAESDLKALKAGTLTLAQFPFEIAPERKAIVTGRGFSERMNRSSKNGQ